MITKADLNKSEVVFNEESHTYLRGEQRLSGITSLIHHVLMLGVYPGATDYVNEVLIPKAGYYGTCVHAAIQTWDELGIECTEYPEKDHPTAGLLPAQDVSQELETYKNLLCGLRTVACEFTVDYRDFASQIDSVKADEDDEIYLVDYKTNNIDYYPGGQEGLEEYLSWQLSCYAFMFERLTGKKVAGLIAMWIRKEKGERWVIERKPDEQVECLLETTIMLTDNGFEYINELMQVHEIPQLIEHQSLAVPQELTKGIASFLEAEKQAKKMKEQLRALMQEHGITKWECDEFTAIIGKDSETTTFDSKAFKEANPDEYSKYLKTSTRKGSFKITLKK